MTKEVIKKLEEAYSWGCREGEAALHAGITYATLHDYEKKHPEFSKRKQQLWENPIRVARISVLRDMQGKKSGELALKFLERKVKNEFSLRQEQTGPGGGAIEIKINKNEVDL